MNLYQNNAFRVLGLLTNATTDQIVARANEIKVKRSVNFDGGYEYDFPWLGALDRSEENIVSALQRLEDPVRRIKQELSWFWQESEPDSQAIKALSNRQIKEAFAIWLKVSGLNVANLFEKEISPLSTPEALVALHNLFVLFQATLLRNELMAKEDQAIVLLDNPPNSQECWAIALRIFNFLHNNEKYWQVVKKRIDQMGDRRVQNISMDEIKESALNNALSAHFSLMTKALGNKDLSTLDNHIEILENANMPVDLYRSGLSLVLNSRIESINLLCDEFVREKKVADDKGDGSVYKSLFYKYRDSAKPLIEDCKSVDRKGMTDFVVSREKFAKSFHQLSWKLNKSGDALGALESINEAYKNLYSDALKMECEKDAQRIMEDALEHYSQEATKLIVPLTGTLGDKAPVDQILNIKEQYINQVKSVFSTGEVFMTDKLQSLLRQLVAKELQLISVEVHDKYQAYEHAQNIIKEAIDWAVEAKNDAFKQQLESVKNDWLKAFELKSRPRFVIEESRRKPVLAWVVGCVLIIAAIFSLHTAIELSSKTPALPPKDVAKISSPSEEPIKDSPKVSGAQASPLAQAPSVVTKALPTAAAVVVPAVVATQAQATTVRENPSGVAVEMPVTSTDQALLSEAAEVKADIDAHKEKIKAMETELDMRRRENEVRQASIDRLDNKIGTNPDSPEYNFWVSEHNDLVREQNAAIEAAKQMYKDYQNEFTRQQDRIISYNERFAR